ncbi:hypothetical protein AAMO2058_000462800 [Amorphochlora amoebiformis]
MRRRTQRHPTNSPMGSKQSSAAKLQELINAGDAKGLRLELVHLRPSVVRRAFRMAVQSMNLKIISEFVASHAVTDRTIRKHLLHSLAPAPVEKLLWLPIQHSRRTKSKLIATICYLASHTNSVDDRDSDGNTILLKACYWGLTELVQYLIERTGANPHLTTKHGETTLMFAVRTGDLNLVRYLVEVQKVKFDVQANGGCTALIMSVLHRQYEIVAYLSGKAKVDMSLKGKIFPSVMFSKKTALEFAKDMNDEKTLDILRTTSITWEKRIAELKKEPKLMYEVIDIRASWSDRFS